MSEVSKLRTERVDQSKRYDIISKIADYQLHETALVREKPWDEQDVQKVRGFFVSAAPYAGNRLFPNYWEHILLASLTARKIAETVRDPSLDPYEGEVLGLSHDCGSPIVPHRYFRKDLVGNVLLRRANTRPEVREKFVPLDRILGMHDPVKGIEDLTIAQRIIHVADNLGRRTPEGKIFTPEDVLTLSSGSKYKDPVWTSERIALSLLNEPGKEEQANKIVYNEALWLKEAYGVDFDKLSKEVDKEFRREENQQWLRDAEDAQETLDTQVDKNLGREGIKHVILDVGGVMLRTSEDSSIAALAKKLGVPRDAVSSMFAKVFYSPEVMSGAISNEQLFANMYSNLGIAAKDASQSEVLFNNPEIYQPIEGMPEVIEQLARNKNVRMVLYTDSILPVADPVTDAVRKFYPGLSDTEILVSSRSGTSKAGGTAYPFLLEHLGNPKPETVLFVDDKQPYTTIVRSGHNMRGFTFRGNQFKDLTAAERLRSELQKAELIK